MSIYEYGGPVTLTPEQKVIYRGDCDEMYGREITIPAHDCSAHIVHRVERCVDRHGLDCGPYEEWTEETWECSVCGADETEIFSEVAQ